MKKAFRNRIKTLITKSVEVRLLIIQKGRSKSALTFDECKQVLHDIEILQSDNQLVKYLLDKQGLLQRMIPAPNLKLRERLDQLILEAENYMKK